MVNVAQLVEHRTIKTRPYDVGSIPTVYPRVTECQTGEASTCHALADCERKVEPVLTRAGTLNYAPQSGEVRCSLLFNGIYSNCGVPSDDPDFTPQKTSGLVRRRIGDRGYDKGRESDCGDSFNPV